MPYIQTPHTLTTPRPPGICEPLPTGRMSTDHQSWNMKVLHGVNTHCGVHHTRDLGGSHFALLVWRGLLSDDLRSRPMIRLPCLGASCAVSLVFFHSTLTTKREPLSLLWVVNCPTVDAKTRHKRLPSGHGGRIGGGWRSSGRKDSSRLR